MKFTKKSKSKNIELIIKLLQKPSYTKTVIPITPLLMKMNVTLQFSSKKEEFDFWFEIFMNILTIMQEKKRKIPFTQQRIENIRKDWEGAGLETLIVRIQSFVDGNFI